MVARARKAKERKPERSRKQTAYYPVDGQVDRKPGAKRCHKAPQLKKSIHPGSILILVTTKYRGKRVVFLKQLKSGLLLIFGPYGINGVPIMRVDQRHVIATSSKIDISSLSIPDHINDEYFRKKTKKDRKQKIEAKKDVFAKPEEAKSFKPPQVHIDDAKSLESQLLSLLSGIPHMKKYLASHFALSNGQYPHNLVF